MIFGMTALTFVHVVLSLIGIVVGAVVMYGLGHGEKGRGLSPRGGRLRHQAAAPTRRRAPISTLRSAQASLGGAARRN